MSLVSLTYGRVALETFGFAFLIFKIAELVMSNWMKEAFKPGGSISQQLSNMYPPKTGNFVEDIFGGIVFAIVAPIVISITVLFTVSALVVPALLVATASVTSILSMSYFAGFVAPARLVLDIAGSIAIAYSGFQVANRITRGSDRE